MANDNMLTEKIPQDVLEKIVEGIKSIETELKPYTVTLTKEQRINRTSMADKTMAFVSKSIENAKMQPTLLPSYIRLEEWEIDIVLIEQIKSLVSKLLVINELLSDTRLEAGHEAYNNALLFYASVKESARANVPGAKVIADELKKQFPRTTKNKNTEE